MKFERARFFGFFLALLGTGFWPLNASDKSADAAKIRQVPKESEAWKGSLADGTPLTRKKLDEMLAAHRVWLETLLEREKAKANMKEENEEKQLDKLLASDWGADQGRLVLRGANLQEAFLPGAKLQNASLRKANLQKAMLWEANLQKVDLVGANLQEVTLAGANLQAAYLSDACLQYANLRDAYLQGANLRRANLLGVDLAGANLQKADLTGANLELVDLWGANLQKAKLVDAYLQKANLKGANLQGAELEGANLQGATLKGAKLQGANLEGADLQGVLYEPDPGSLPDVVGLRSAYNLETLRFIASPHGLEELKEAFKKAGMRQQEREITYAIKRSELENAWGKGHFWNRLDSTFNWVLFDLPVGYGLYPGRALQILGALIPVFALLYGWAIGRPTGNYGIYRIRPKERIEATQSGVGMADDTTVELLQAKGWRIIPHALYFSLLSTFHIGWRELNVGNWISRLQLHPYTLQGTGWLRTVSGIQSLISVYLLAMWALSYFGRPFE